MFMFQAQPDDGPKQSSLSGALADPSNKRSQIPSVIGTTAQYQALLMWAKIDVTLSHNWGVSAISPILLAFLESSASVNK